MVSTTASLEQIYDKDKLKFQTERYANLKAAFAKMYGGEQPSFIVRAPGRVNLIGEHIDYSLYSVLPMALSDKDIIIACRPRPADGQLNLANMEGTRFPAKSFADLKRIVLDNQKHEWTNYFLGGVKSVLNHFPTDATFGMDCLIDGRVPTGAGVSSSAAFVTSAALTTINCYPTKPDVSKSLLSQLAIKAEHLVGVETGGMDQTASVFGVKNSALAIHFYPKLEVESVPFPKAPNADLDPVFVISHSLVVSDKHVTAPVCYNLRVVECRFASLMLAKTHLKTDDWKSVMTMREFQERYFAENASDKKLNMLEQLSEMAALVEETFSKKGGYTMAEVSELLQISTDTLETKCVTFTIHAEKFQLYKRAKHVFTEAARVFRFKTICQEQRRAATAEDYKKILAELGKLMNESHESCDKLFDCSCSELNQLTELARASGAFGSRLTGAGWGGCSVSLVQRSKAADFLSTLREKYYKVRDISRETVEDYLFYSSPGAGATVITGL